MIVIGVDPHKLTHTATAVESATNTDLASIRVEASLEEYRRLLRWAGSWPERTWAVENADGLGNHLAQWLVAAGETVLDVAASATARVRLSRGGRRKNDRIDAAAAACVAALQGDARRVAPDDASTSLRLLDERRPAAEPVPSTSCMRCCVSCWPAAPRRTCRRRRPRRCCARSGQRLRQRESASSWLKNSLPTAAVTTPNWRPTPKR